MTPIVAALRDPPETLSWTIAQWELLVRQARSADLLSRLAALLQQRGLLDQVPAAPRTHLLAARTVGEAQEEAVHREVSQVRKALTRIGVEIVLLKGAAYLYAGLPAAQGRVFSDIDFLVPRAALPQVEAALMLHGWATTHHEPYDQRYYREWMHELPPMQHVTRQTVLDVHHAIVPLTARLKPDSAKLLAAARPVPERPGLKVLAPEDMVLHSAAHLFLNEELSHGLRDLVDLDSLLRHFGGEQGFWTSLPARAVELDLERPLRFALRYSNRMLGTPVPTDALSASVSPWMDALFLRALQPDHPTAGDGFTPVARWLLYVRAHWLRLPPGRLAYHLAVKALRKQRERAKPEQPAPAAR
jgi:hypothetical protein